MPNKASQLLLNLGLKQGDTIAIIRGNRPEWNFIDFGAQQIGNRQLCIQPFATKDYEYIFNDAAIQYAFIDQ